MRLQHILAYNRIHTPPASRRKSVLMRLVNPDVLLRPESRSRKRENPTKGKKRQRARERKKKLSLVHELRGKKTREKKEQRVAWRVKSFITILGDFIVETKL